jgi:hypothetical protein
LNIELSQDVALDGRADFESVLIDLDRLQPADRLRRLSHSPTDREDDTSLRHALAEERLLALYGLNAVLQRRLSTSYFFYFLEDQSVEFAVRQTQMGLDAPPSHIESAYVRLGCAQLIYRFSAAVKFGQSCASKQLRINSWGRQYVEQVDLMAKYKPLSDNLTGWFENYFQEHAGCYRELATRLLAPDVQESAQRVAVLNDSLDVRLLS